THSYGLSVPKIYDIIEEANRSAENDRRIKEVIIARNRLEGLLQNTIRSFGEFGWMLSAEDQEFVRSTLDNARATAISEDAQEVRAALEQLESAAKMITDAMFRPTGLTSSANPAKSKEEAPLPEFS